jgi:hypothetical protein
MNHEPENRYPGARQKVSGEDRGRFGWLWRALGRERATGVWVMSPDGTVHQIIVCEAKI